MIQIALHRSLSWAIAYSDVMRWEAGKREIRDTDGEIQVAR
jgi:hypothetical protein